MLVLNKGRAVVIKAMKGGDDYRRRRGGVGDVGPPLSSEAQRKALRRQRMRVPTSFRTPDEVKVCNAR
jgi:hypothetical protein